MLTKVRDDMISGLDKSDVGLENVDNTSDANKPVSNAAQTALNAKENSISAGTTSQYWRGDKSWQALVESPGGLGKVGKPLSTATQTALKGKKATLSAGTNITIDRTNPAAPIISASGGSGGGDVTGPASSTAAGVAGFNDTTGKALKQLSATEVRTAASLATSDSPQFAGINLGHASDTTLTRTGAGVIAVEGVEVVTVSATQTLSAKTLTSPVVNTPTLNNAITVEGYAFNTSTNAAVDLANGTLQVPTLTGNWTTGAGWPAATLAQ